MYSSKVTLPEEFIRRMRDLLGHESEAFLEALREPRARGLRLNTLRTEPGPAAEKAPFSLRPLPWVPEGFLYHDPDRPGLHPWYDAGVYYIQEPSAMAAAVLLDPQPGDLVLDLAAAPGGKASHLAARLANQGLLVANEPNPKRCRVLVQNLERLGIANALVTQEHPKSLLRWAHTFDRVLVDAPCTGESMFRKDPGSVAAWSERRIRRHADLQQQILSVAADLVRPGGRLLYATCTFSPEENEQVIAWFLNHRPDYRLLPARLPGAAPGRPEWADGREDLSLCCRFWPHLAPVDGHFYALLERLPDAQTNAPGGRPRRSSGRRSAKSTQLPGRVAAVIRDHLPNVPLPEQWDQRGDMWIALPDSLPRLGSLDGLKIVSKGVAWGVVRGSAFIPAHSLAMALSREAAPASVVWSSDDPQVLEWLKGYSLPAPPGLPPGWVWVGVDGFPLGWGKIADGQLKNHYPKGLCRELEFPLGVDEPETEE